MKGCGVTALVFGVLGLVLVMAGGSMVGRNTIARVVEEATGGRVQMNTYGWGNWGFAWKSDFFDDMFDNAVKLEVDTVDLGEASSAAAPVDSGYPIYSGNVEKYCLGSDAVNLEMEVGGCVFETKPSGDSNIYLEAKKAHNLQGYVEDAILYLRADTGGMENWEDMGKCKVTLYLPEGYRFEVVNINVGAGTMDFEGLQAENAYMEVGAGQIVLKDAEVNDLILSVGAGLVKLEDMEVSTLDAEIGLGEFVAGGAVKDNVYVECSMGNVELELEGRKRDFNYYISNATGNVELDGDSYGGLSGEHNIDNGAGKDMTVDCAMGNISIDFTE